MKRLLVSGLWNDFSRKVLPKDASTIQRQEMRRAFYAGCESCLRAIEACLDPGSEATDADLRMMEDFDAELKRFAVDVKEGRA